MNSVAQEQAAAELLWWQTAHRVAIDHLRRCVDCVLTECHEGARLWQVASEADAALPWNRVSFAVHFENCRTRLAGDWCERCDTLDRRAEGAP